MDKVLKRRLIGASILIALAVIFVPMLLVDPESVRDRAGDATDVPPMPESAREVRRIPLDPEAARVPPSERALPPHGEGADSPRAPGAATRNRVSPDQRIVLRPDLAGPETLPNDDETASAGDRGRLASGVDGAAGQPESTGVSAPAESDTGTGTESNREANSESNIESNIEYNRANYSGQAAETGPLPMGKWVVQVASFGSQDSADQVRARLEALGHIVVRDEIVRGQSLLYRLRTGPYPNRAAAEQALAQISATVAGVQPIVREIDEAMREDMQAGFAVQVGSFVSEDNADSEAARLAGLGFESFRFSEQIGERLIWRVMVGPVAERDQADALKSRVVEQAGVEGLVVSYP